MKIGIRDQSSFGAGVLLTAIAVLFLILGSDLEQGTALQMGPGYFPRLVSYCLVVTGLLLIGYGVLSGSEMLFAIRWRPMIMILGSIVFFGVCLESVGLVITSFVTVMIASYAMAQPNWLTGIASGAMLTAVVSLVFVKGLGLAISLWPSF